MNTSKKLERYVEGNAIEPMECYAVPGENSMIDAIHPVTGLTIYSHNTKEELLLRYPDAVRMTIDEFCEQKAARQHSPISWLPVTEETYWEMLECLPPAYRNGNGFLVGEPCDHDASNGQPRYQAFVKWHWGTDKAIEYRQASRPMTIKEYRALSLDGSTQVPA
jgi:hypothetical protein